MRALPPTPQTECRGADSMEEDVIQAGLREAWERINADRRATEEVEDDADDPRPPPAPRRGPLGHGGPWTDVRGALMDPTWSLCFPACELYHMLRGVGAVGGGGCRWSGTTPSLPRTGLTTRRMGVVPMLSSAPWTIGWWRRRRWKHAKAPTSCPPHARLPMTAKSSVLRL